MTTFWHGTAEAAVPSILAAGLRPDPQGRVYLTRSYVVAWQYAAEDTAYRQDAAWRTIVPRVVRVKLSRSQVRGLTPDPFAREWAEAWVHAGAVPAARVSR